MDEVKTRAELVREGVGRRALERAEREGALVKLRRDAWAESIPLGIRERHLQLVRAASRGRSDDTVVSHLSAAAIWGHPLPGVVEEVWFTRPGSGGGHRRAGMRIVRSPLEPSEWTLQDGLRVTCIDRTVVDVARTQDFLTGVVVADAALHAGLRRTDLESALARSRRWPGAARARAVLAAADGRAESSYESLLRVELVDLAIGDVVPQYVVMDGDDLLARVDLAIPELMLAVEYDGLGKYDELARRGQRPGDVFAAEKHRDELLRARGWTMLHLGLDDVRDPARLRSKVLSAAKRARARMVARSSPSAA